MYEQITPESIEAAILEGINEWNTDEGSFSRALIAPVSYEIWKYYTALEGIPDMIFVNENSGIYIDRKAADYGITRKPGTKAEAALSLTGRAGLTVPSGKVFLTEDGLAYLLQEQVILDSSGNGNGRLAAQETGSDYNQPAGAICRQQSTLSGLSSFSSGAASGGVNMETDAQLLDRYYDYIRKPATSGNVYQYEQWAKSVTGVGEARVFPLWNGAGTVKVVISDENYGVAPQATISACAAYLEQVRPIGADVTVTSASELDLNVTATVVIDASTTTADVKTQFTQSMNDYLRSITFQKDEVIYNRVLFLLLDIPGVQDVSTMTINGTTENITVDDMEIPTLKVVSINV